MSSEGEATTPEQNHPVHLYPSQSVRDAVEEMRQGPTWAALSSTLRECTAPAEVTYVLERFRYRNHRPIDAPRPSMSEVLKSVWNDITAFSEIFDIVGESRPLLLRRSESVALEPSAPNREADYPDPFKVLWRNMDSATEQSDFAKSRGIRFVPSRWLSEQAMELDSHAEEFLGQRPIQTLENALSALDQALERTRLDAATSIVRLRLAEKDRRRLMKYWRLHCDAFGDAWTASLESILSGFGIWRDPDFQDVHENERSTHAAASEALLKWGALIRIVLLASGEAVFLRRLTTGVRRQLRALLVLEHRDNPKSIEHRLSALFEDCDRQFRVPGFIESASAFNAALLLLPAKGSEEAD